MANELEDLVVFLTPAGEPFSMDPRWADSTVREAWKAHQRDKSKAADDQEEEEEFLDYQSMTNEDLRGELAARGLDVSGKKADMVQRLEEDDAKE